MTRRDELRARVDDLSIQLERLTRELDELRADNENMREALATVQQWTVKNELLLRVNPGLNATDPSLEMVVHSVESALTIRVKKRG